MNSQAKPVMVVAGLCPFWLEDRGDLVRVARLLRAIMEAGYEVNLFHCGVLTAADRTVLAADWPSLTLYESECALPRMREGSRFARLRRWLAYAVTRKPFYCGRKSLMAGETTLAQWFCPTTRRTFRRLCRQLRPDAVLVQRVTLLYLVQGRRGLPPGCKVMVDTLDVMSQRAASFHAAGYAHWLDITRTEEQRVLRDADAILAIQDEDAGTFREMVPQAQVLTVLHAMPAQPLPPVVSDGVTVLYAAAGGIANVAAIRDFLHSVWPAVHAGSGGQARLLIAGGVCGALGAATLPLCVTLHGPYGDLRSLMAKADIVINPVQFGGGLKIKNIEALCCGRALITSPEGAQGMRDGVGTAFLTADSPSGMQTVLIELIRQPERRQALAAAGMAYASRTFAEAFVYAAFLDYLGRK